MTTKTPTSNGAGNKAASVLRPAKNRIDSGSISRSTFTYRHPEPCPDTSGYGFFFWLRVISDAVLLGGYMVALMGAVLGMAALIEMAGLV